MQVFVSFLLSTKHVALLLYSFLIRFIVAGFALAIGFSLGFVGGAAATGFVIFYIAFPLWALLRRRRRKTLGWLGYGRESLRVRTAAHAGTLIPSESEWLGLSSFVLKGRGGKVELSFSTRENASAVAERIRSAFPGLRERPVSWENMLGLSKPRL